jgi:hypothetical protein
MSSIHKCGDLNHQYVQALQARIRGQEGTPQWSDEMSRNLWGWRELFSLSGFAIETKETFSYLPLENLLHLWSTDDKFDYRNHPAIHTAEWCSTDMLTIITDEGHEAHCILDWSSPCVIPLVVRLAWSAHGEPFDSLNFTIYGRSSCRKDSGHCRTSALVQGTSGWIYSDHWVSSDF